MKLKDFYIKIEGKKAACLKKEILKKYLYIQINIFIKNIII